MGQSGRKESQIGMGAIILASVLLLGIVVLAAGYFSGNRIAFYAGVLVTLAGVLTGLRQLIVRDNSRRTKP